MSGGRNFLQLYRIGFIHFFRVVVCLMLVAGWVMIVVEAVKGYAEAGPVLVLALFGFGLVFTAVVAVMLWLATRMLRAVREG